jgi:hypothetical protein
VLEKADLRERNGKAVQGPIQRSKTYTLFEVHKATIKIKKRCGGINLKVREPCDLLEPVNSNIDFSLIRKANFRNYFVLSQYYP